MLKSYKFRIYPNRKQRIQIHKTFGSCRFIYNWALDFKTKRYQQHKENINRFELSKMLTFFKKTEERSWLKEVNAQSLQSELRHLDSSFTNFFRHNAKYPHFKKKNSKQSYDCPQHVDICFDDKKVKIPKLGKVNYHDRRTFFGDIKTCTVSMNRAHQYYISILVDNGFELPSKKKIDEDKSIGIDVGIKSYCVMSNGDVVDNPHHLKNKLNKLKVYQRRLSKKKKGSSNRYKQKLKVARIHNDITNTRKDFINKLTTNIIKNHDTIFVEDLNIRGMLKNHHLALSISDVSWSEFFRQIEYKSEWYGNNLIKIGRFEPSSRTCDICGLINERLKLSDREWTCECGAVHDRDLLAARNIKHFGLMKLKYNTRQGMPEEPVDILRWQMDEAGTFN